MAEISYPTRIARALTIAFPILLLWPVPPDIALCIIAALFVLHCYMQKDWSWCREYWVWALTALWLYMIARGLFAEHPKEALARALPFGRYIVFAAALARWTLADVPTRQRFQIVLTGAVIFAMLDGILQYFTGFDLFHRPLLIDSANHIRLTGPFAKPIIGIMLAWLVFPALLPYLLGRQSRLRIAAIICLFVVIAAIAFSGERMALLLTLLGCVLSGLAIRSHKRLILTGIGGMIALLGLIAIVSPNMFERQIIMTEDTLLHWQQSPYGELLTSDLALATQHPVIGLGANHFRTACETLYAGDKDRIALKCNTHPHNIWLEWLIEEGVIGFMLFAAFVIVILRDSLRAFLLPPDPLFAGLLIAFVLRIWPFMSSTNFFSRWGAPPFWLVLGALLVYTVKKPEQKSDADSSLTLQNSGL